MATTKPVTPTTSLGMLTLLAGFLREAEPPEARLVWDVLSALRGPDNSAQDKNKATMTEPIRAKLICLGVDPFEHQNKIYSANRRIFIDISLDDAYKRDLRHKESETGNGERTHFLTHARAAFAALKMEW